MTSRTKRPRDSALRALSARILRNVEDERKGLLLAFLEPGNCAPDLLRTKAQPVHQSPRGSNLVFFYAAVRFGEMSHGLKQRPHELIGQLPQARSRNVGPKFAETIRESAIELVTQQQSNNRDPRTTGCQSGNCANDLTPEWHSFSPVVRALAPCVNANRSCNVFLY